MKVIYIFASALAKETSGKIEDAIKTIKEFLPKVIPRIIELEFSTKEEDLDTILTQLFDAPEKIANKRGKKMVVAFDEFQEIKNIDGESLEREMRSKIQHHHKVAYVFIGSKRHLIDRLFNDRSRPFYNIGKFFSLGKIPKQEFMKFIRENFEKTGIIIKTEFITEILNITDAHPYYTQMLCHEVWNEAIANKEISMDTINRARDSVISGQSYAFTTIWDTFSQKQRNLLLALSDGNDSQLYSQNLIQRYDLGSPATVAKSLKMLEIKEIIEKENSKIVFSDIFFREWIKKKIL